MIFSSQSPSSCFLVHSMHQDGACALYKGAHRALFTFAHELISLSLWLSFSRCMRLPSLRASRPLVSSRLWAALFTLLSPLLSPSSPFASPLLSVSPLVHRLPSSRLFSGLDPLSNLLISCLGTIDNS